jgi:hypothetical protein
MRQATRGLVLLALVLCAGSPAHAQTVTHRDTRAATRLVPSLLADSLAFRSVIAARTTGNLFAAIYTVDSLQTRSACPMPVMHPDSTRQFSALAGQALRFTDPMPVVPTTCTNPLDVRR